MARAGVAKVWVAVTFIDDAGVHEAGDQYDIPVHTAEQRAQFAALMARGVLSETETQVPARSGGPYDEGLDDGTNDGG